MAPPVPGIYEQLLTRALDEELKLLEPELLRRAPLNPADAHETRIRG